MLWTPRTRQLAQSCDSSTRCAAPPMPMAPSTRAARSRCRQCGNPRRTNTSEKEVDKMIDAEDNMDVEEMVAPVVDMDVDQGGCADRDDKCHVYMTHQGRPQIAVLPQPRV